MTISEVLNQAIEQPLKNLKHIRIFQTEYPEITYYLNADDAANFQLCHEGDEANLTVDELRATDWQMKIEGK